MNGILLSIGRKLARGEVRAAREGKRGVEIMGILKMIDGYKRVILLALFMLVAWLKAAGLGDYIHVVDALMSVVDWKPDSLPVPASLIFTTVAGIYAIVDGVKKAAAARAAADKIMR